MFRFFTRPRRSTPRPRNYRPRIEAMEERCLLATFTVINALDSGAGSLRDAITHVNSDTGNLNTDTIKFNIPGPTPHTIHLLSDLPTLTHSVVLDAGSEPGFTTTPVVFLDGTNDKAGGGIGVPADGSAWSGTTFTLTVRGLGENHFATGISIQLGAAPSNLRVAYGAITTGDFGTGVDILGDSSPAATGAVTAVLVHNQITAPGGLGVEIIDVDSSVNVMFGSDVINASDAGAAVNVFFNGAVTATFNNCQLSADGGGLGVFFDQDASVNATFTGNRVSATSGGEGIVFDNGDVTTSMSNNHIFGDGGGAGIDFALSHSVNATLTSNTISASGGIGVNIDQITAAVQATLRSNTVSATVGGTALNLGEGGTSTSLTVAGNTVKSSMGGVALRVFGTSPATTVASISNNVFNTFGTGTGLLVEAGAGFQAIVQANSFKSNKVGAEVHGDGTSAGNIDLGSDNPGGSTGGNDFSTFTNRTAAHFAIGLFDVASDYTLSALHNIWTGDPTKEIADGTHDVAAGGSGKILV
jgi:hypothetical protein